MIAVDASIIIDIIFDDPEFGEKSGLALSEAGELDDLVICDAALAEVCSYSDPIEPLLERLASAGIRYSGLSEQAAVRAGIMQQRYRKRGGTRMRVVSDFLVGAHAMFQCDALITRDTGFYRDYFKGLKLIDPAAS